MQAVDVGRIALIHAASWNVAPSIRIFFDDRQVIEGTATAFTNGAIEAAVLHCRALLDFMGLKASGPETLATRANAQKDDIVIESTGLPKVSVEDAIRLYAGPKVEAESALAHVIFVANKGLAHMTSSFGRDSGEAHLLEIAFRGVPKLVVEHFYRPLGLKEPLYETTGRPAI